MIRTYLARRIRWTVCPASDRLTFEILAVLRFTVRRGDATCRSADLSESDRVPRTAMINRQIAESAGVVYLPGYQRPWLRTERTGGVEQTLRKVLMVSHTPGPLRRATAQALTGGVAAF